ncbi:transposon tx1 uncharacterized 149 kda protein [Plakobranchus ocellatus]|uniref:Transposon tx1 uncharacterized 149 kDa protein n=1 Tax=Plakobranchus ocellatus TaxID=259542 RepID=A0AAV4BLA2_9GAST|nr:transposon tx1 uncharacterized 149 kda protein [Plakobranchus ocellatus]
MNGDIIIDKEKILERWAEYIRELFKDDRKDNNIMKNNFAGPPIMKEEVETAIKKMKHGNATGPDNISVELIEALEDFGIGKVTHLLNEMYDTGQISIDLSKSIFIALPKKPGATECELHRTISLMSRITKILLKIIMLRIRNKIKPEIAEEHLAKNGKPNKQQHNAVTNPERQRKESGGYLNIFSLAKNGKPNKRQHNTVTIPERQRKESGGYLNIFSLAKNGKQNKRQHNTVTIPERQRNESGGYLNLKMTIS